MSTALVIGSGGREHALAWKLAQSPRVTRLIAAPGNDGFPEEIERWAVDLSRREEFERLAEQAVREKVDLVVVGPDNPLADGIVDLFESRGLLCFGPSAGAARIEASKAFAKEVMSAAGVPTARYFVAETLEEAKEALRSGGEWVVKADGLALGKGVRLCGTHAEAIAAVAELLPISGQVVIEERLRGEELSWLALCDGSRCALLEPARDHKRLLDRDNGPNTGGMGAFSPVPGVPVDFAERVRREVFQPTLREMSRRGVPFKGVLYAGLMVDFEAGKYWVLEFNARFGDPETQVLLPRIAPGEDFYTWCEAVARRDLSLMPETVPFSSESAVVVVAAAPGYPEKPEKGQGIEFVGASSEKRKGVPPFFFAGVARKEKRLVTSGGRVLGAVGMGKDLAEARAQAYRRIDQVRFPGMQHRKDIGA